MERGRPGLRAQGFGGKKSTQDQAIDAPIFIGSKLRTEQKSFGAAGEGTFNLGRASITLGGEYEGTKTTQSLPENKIGIPENVQRQIYKKLSAGLGYNITPDIKISGFVDRSRITGGKGRNTKTVQLSGNVKGNRFVGSISDRDGEKVGRFSLVIPFAHGGTVKPRGRKARY